MIILKWLLFILLIPLAFFAYFYQIFFDILIGWHFLEYYDTYKDYEKKWHSVTDDFLLFWGNLIFIKKG